jgi:hypothetical protein
MPKDNINHLPVVEAVEDLKESNKDNRERLQKSLRAGLLNVRKSVDALAGSFERSLIIQGDAQRRLFESNLEFQERSLEQGKHSGHLFMSKMTAFGAGFVAFFEEKMVVELKEIKSHLQSMDIGVKKDSKEKLTTLGQLSEIRKSLDGSLKDRPLYKILEILKKELADNAANDSGEEVQANKALEQNLEDSLKPDSTKKKVDEQTKKEKKPISWIASLAQILVGGVAAATLLLNLDKVYDGLQMFTRAFGFIGDGLGWMASKILPAIGNQLDWITFLLATFFGGKLLWSIGATIFAIGVWAKNWLVVHALILANTISTVATFATMAGGKLLFWARALLTVFILTAAQIVSTVATFAAMAGGKLLFWARALAAGIVTLGTSIWAASLALIPALAAAAPFIAIAAAISWALYGLYKGFQDAKEVYEDTGSMWLAVKAGMYGFIRAIITLPAKLAIAIGVWVAEVFGFDDFAKKLDAIDTDKIFDDIVNSIGNLMKKIGDWFIDKWDSLMQFLGFADADPLTQTEKEEIQKMKLYQQNRNNRRMNRGNNNTSSGGVTGAVIENVSALQSSVSQPPIIIDNSSAPTAVDASSTTSISNVQQVTGQASRRKRAQQNRERNFQVVH